MHMKRRLAALACAACIALGFAPMGTAGAVAGQAGVREVIDMAGRTVMLPTRVDKLFGTDPVATILLYTLSPDTLIGWNYALNAAERAYIPEPYASLPVLGMHDGVLEEAVLAAAPGALLLMGEVDGALAARADAMQARLGVPVLVADARLTAAPEAYRLLGEVTGRTGRAGALADWAQGVLTRAAALPAPHATVYFGNGEDGLETAPRGGMSAEVLALAGGDNVAVLEAPSGDRLRVTAEQLLAWDPQWILLTGQAKQSLSGAQAAQMMYDNPSFAPLTAVRARRVMGVPGAPFAWVGRPLGVGQLIGVAWVHALLTDVPAETLALDVADFYALFYGVTLTHADACAMLAGAMPDAR